MMKQISSRPATYGRHSDSQHHPPAPHADEVIKTSTALKVVIDNVLIWLFWGSADYFAGHGHPFLSDACFFLFYAALVATFAIIVNTFWRRPRVLFAASVVLCLAIGALIFSSSPWPAFFAGASPFLAVVASIASAVLWYRLSRRMVNEAEMYKLEVIELRAELYTAKQVDAEIKAQAEKLQLELSDANKSVNASLGLVWNLQQQLDATKAAVAPRALSTTQRAMLRENLPRMPESPVVVLSRLMDAEGAAFGNELGLSLMESGWTVAACNMYTGDEVGVAIATVGGLLLPGMNQLQLALKSVGITPELIPKENNDARIPSGFQNGIIYLLVGVKPPLSVTPTS